MKPKKIQEVKSEALHNDTFFIALTNSIYAQKKPSEQPQPNPTEEYNKIQKCVQQATNLCANDPDKNCPQKKWNQLPPNCKQYSDAAVYMNPDNIISGNVPGPMGDCLKQMQKLCAFDNALARKNMDKAAKKYKTCVENAAPKLKGECKKLLNSF